MANCIVKFTWCACRNYKIQVQDSHDKCLLCLGIQHAKEAVLEYGKCPHCAKMDWGTCIKRLTKVQELIHKEAQQRKNEMMQTLPKPKPEVPSASDQGVQSAESVCATLTTSQTDFQTQASRSSSVPVMFALLPSPSLPVPAAEVVKDTFVSHVGLQHPQDPVPCMEQVTSPQVQPSAAQKSRHSSKCHSCCMRHMNRGCRRKRKRSPASSPSSSESSCAEKSWDSANLERQHEQFLETMKQKLESQQKAMELQWGMMVKRLEHLEKRSSMGFPTNSEGVPQVSTVSQGQQTAPNASSYSSAPISPLNIIKIEDGPVNISCSSGSILQPEAQQGSDCRVCIGSSPTESALLTSQNLQSLIMRAIKFLRFEFPNLSNDDPPIMPPEFEDLVQASWSNPMTSKAFRSEFSNLYRLHCCQSPAYDEMPKVGEFMSALFQVIKPTKDRVPSLPGEHWKSVEDLVEKAYQSAGMLAKTANYLRYLSEYQKHLTAVIPEEPQRLKDVLTELHLIGQFTSQLSSHQGELSGRVMAASVAVCRHAWMAKTNYKDSLKATVADLPFVINHSVEEDGASNAEGDPCGQDM